MIIQRPQALYFLLCAVCAAIGARWGFPDAVLASVRPAGYVLYAVAAVAFLSIFLFRHLRAQAWLAKGVLMIDAIVFVIFVVRGLDLSGGAVAPEKGVGVTGLLLLFASMVLALAASRAVKKDLRTVKSADRLR